MKKNKGKGDRASVIEDGVQYYGDVTKATKKLCYITFDDGDEGIYKYDELAAKVGVPSTGEPEVGGGASDEDMVTVNNLMIPRALYKRASKKIGLTDVQISSYPDAESLKQALDGMHPQSNPDARISQGKPPKIRNFEDNMPDSFELESVIEAKFIKANRDNYDRGNLESFLCRVNRKYGVQKPVRIVQDRSFKVVKRELVTSYVIYYK